VLAAGGTGAGVRASGADGTGTGVLAPGGTGAGARLGRAAGGLGTGDGVQPGRHPGGLGTGDGAAAAGTAVGAGEGPAGAGVGDPLGTGAGVGAPDGTGVGVGQPRWPVARVTLTTAECETAESSPAAAGWASPPDPTAMATPPASRAAGSPSQAIARVPGVLMLTSSSGRPGWPAVAVGTCGRPIWLHGRRVRYATSGPGRPGTELAYGERT
jgi:hypothetical protein